MKFRNYCAIFMANVDGIEVEVIKIAESKPNVLNAKGIVIITFTSNVEPIELSDYFKMNGRSFFVFDLNAENSGVHINKPDIHEGLFGFLKRFDSNALSASTTELIDGLILDSIRYGESVGETLIPFKQTKKELTLEEQLEEAIQSENYELAAKIRDKLGLNT